MATHRGFKFDCFSRIREDTHPHVGMLLADVAAGAIVWEVAEEGIFLAVVSGMTVRYLFNDRPHIVHPSEFTWDIIDDARSRCDDAALRARRDYNDAMDKIGKRREYLDEVARVLGKGKRKR